MKKILLTFVFILFLTVHADCATLEAGVSTIGRGNRVVDSATNLPVAGAQIKVPQKNYNTYTDSDGVFMLDASINGDTILSVEKEGYKPFSLTINEQMASKPLVLGIEKAGAKDIVIDSNMFHLGDNSFSDLSANAGEFRVKAIGPYFSKKFSMANFIPGASAYLVIGSIIGIDTALARSMGQNKITNAFASPPEVFFNGSKIAEIQLNGDGQRIKIPSNLIMQNVANEVTVKTGRNLMQRAYVDYDDIEFMNLSIEIK